MPDRTKILTCCYCSTRAVLTLNSDRHELVCSGCGAPLHHIKPLRVARSGTAAEEPASQKREKSREKDRKKAYKEYRKPKKRKQKRHKSMTRLLGKIWDEIEDVFD
ncbi:MAG: hypothetical protein AAFR93_05115 [Pseudomonadota bacterium]